VPKPKKTGKVFNLNRRLMGKKCQKETHLLGENKHVGCVSINQRGGGGETYHNKKR